MKRMIEDDARRVEENNDRRVEDDETCVNMIT